MFEKDPDYFPCIIPTLVEDYIEMRSQLYLIFDRLSVSKLIFIGPSELEKYILVDSGNLGTSSRIDYINENDILPFDLVKQAYESRLSEITSAYGAPERISRAGWYYQQFLKMEFHRLCDSEYYLCWDADTIPLKPINMFHSSGLPYFDLKPEYMNSYFDTLHNLFGFSKVIEQSFISEHMLIKRNFMSEMINEIMSRPLKGNTYYEKIFSAVTMPFNGFSEFETYGTWVAIRHLNTYRLRNWKSLRNTNFMVSRKELTNDDLTWLATGFDAASFERYQETEPVLRDLFLNPGYRNKLPADIFYNTLLEMGVFGDYRDGGLIVGNNKCPV